MGAFCPVNMKITLGVLIAVDEGEIVARCWMDLNYAIYDEQSQAGVLDDLFVIQSRQGQGIATRMIDEAEKFLLSHGKTVGELGVTFENPGPLSLYIRKGYIEEKRFIDESDPHLPPYEGAGRAGITIWRYEHSLVAFKTLPGTGVTQENEVKDLFNTWMKEWGNPARYDQVKQRRRRRFT